MALSKINKYVTRSRHYKTSSNVGCLLRSIAAKSDFFWKESSKSITFSLPLSLVLQSRSEYEPASYFVMGLPDNYG